MRPTAFASTSSTASASNGPDMRDIRNRLPRRSAPPRLTPHREPTPRRIYSSKETQPCPAGLLQPRAKGGVRETSAEPCLGDEHVDLSEALVGSVNFILQLSSLAVLGTRCGRSPGRR